MSREKLTKTVVLVGMMGAGKTAVGTALAEMLDVEFRDSDHEMELAANLTISEIFSKFGEPFFREKETLVIERLLMDEPCVLSTGGGAFLLQQNRDIVAKNGLSVWLKADPELLWARVKHKDTRPLLKVADPRAKLLELYAARLPSYAQAGLTVEADKNYSIQDMAKKVLDTLASHPGRIVRKT